MIPTETWVLPRPRADKYVGLTGTQAAYLAALIDGEGSIDCQREPIGGKRRTPVFVVRLEFGMATEEPLRTVGHWLGMEPRWYPAPSEERRPRWRLQVPKRLALAVLEECLPYLILKRDQAETVLELERVRREHSPPRSLPPGLARRMPPEAVDRMELLHARLRELKR